MYISDKSQNLKFQTVSLSSLWPLMERLFIERGVDLWHRDIIPHQATTNSFTAYLNARAAEVFIQEQIGDKASSKSDPAYIIEIGAGTGRYGHHFIKHLFGPDPKKPRVENIVYVMTDIAEANLAYWRDKPQFKPYIDAGLLDFALHDAIKDETLKLEYSKTLLKPGAISQPVVLIGNYLFCSIATDFFELRQGQLFEKLLAVSLEEKEGLLEEVIKNIKYEYSSSAIEPEYYKKKYYNDILKSYKEQGGDFEFSIPVGGFEIIENVSALSKGPSLTLINDYGYVNKYIVQKNKVKINNNGNCTVAVNFDALKKYITAQDGHVLQRESAIYEIVSTGYVLGADLENIHKTLCAFQDDFAAFTPDDYAQMFRLWGKRDIKPKLSEAISLIRLARYDSRMFLLCREAFVYAADAIRRNRDVLLGQTILEIADKVRDFSYNFEGAYDPSMELAQIYLMLGQPSKGAEILEKTRNLHGELQGYQAVLDRCRSAQDYDLEEHW